MATTTFAAVRAEQVALIEALTPTSLSGDKFSLDQGEQDFREWVDESKRASFRRFAIVDLHEYDPVDISDLSTEFLHGRQEIVIAYPDDYRYGPDGNRSRGDVMREDLHQIQTSVGPRGYLNLTNSTITEPEDEIEELDGVMLLVIKQRVHFYRSF